MKRQAITVTIDRDGNVSVAVEGVPGPRCETVTRELEDSLGTVVARKQTTEYYQPVTEGRRIQKHTR